MAIRLSQDLPCFLKDDGLGSDLQPSEAAVHYQQGARVN